MITFKPPYSDECVALYLSRRTYPATGGVRLDLIDAVDHLPFATCTVSLKNLEKNEVAIKDYSENEGVLQLLITEGIIEKPHRYVNSDYVKIPVCLLK